MKGEQIMGEILEAVLKGFCSTLGPNVTYGIARRSCALVVNKYAEEVQELGLKAYLPKGIIAEVKE